MSLSDADACSLQMDDIACCELVVSVKSPTCLASEVLYPYEGISMVGNRKVQSLHRSF